MEDLGRKRLNDAVTVTPSPTSSDMKWVTHYGLSPNVREMAQRVDALKDSHIFRTFWEGAAEALSPLREEGAQPLVDVEDAYKVLYLPCLDKFHELYEDLKSGELTLVHVDTIFKVFVNRYRILTTDLNTMCTLDPRDPKDWVPERVGQIREYHHLQRAADVAKVIREVKEALGLTGDFKVLHILLRLVSCSPGTPGVGAGSSPRLPGSQTGQFHRLLQGFLVSILLDTEYAGGLLLTSAYKQCGCSLAGGSRTQERDVRCFVASPRSHLAPARSDAWRVLSVHIRKSALASAV